MKELTPKQRFAEFLEPFSPEIQTLVRQSLAKLRARVPGAVEMVYDNYNALVIGFGATERASEAILSIAAYARGVSLCFLTGARLADPQRILLGSGSVARHVKLAGARDIDRREVGALIARAIESSVTPFDSAARGRMVIKSVSAKQRPRKPAR